MINSNNPSILCSPRAGGVNMLSRHEVVVSQQCNDGNHSQGWGRNCPTMSDSETICHCEREREGRRDITICQCQNTSLTNTRAVGASGLTLCSRNIWYSSDFLNWNVVQCDLAICRGEQHGLMPPLRFYSYHYHYHCITCPISPCYSILLYKTTFGRGKTNKKNNPELLRAITRNRIGNI